MADNTTVKNYDTDAIEGKRKREEGSPNFEVQRLKRARSEPPYRKEYGDLPKIAGHNPSVALSKPCRIISPEAMAMVKLQLSQLASKNRGMKASMQEMRESVVGELMSVMKTRRIVIEQLGRERIEPRMRIDCEELLAKRKAHMMLKEDELLMLEQMLIGHEAVLEHADSACIELEAKIKAYELDRKWDSSYTLNDLPQMSALARLTGGGTMFKQMTIPVLRRTSISSSLEMPAFPEFMNLPSELRVHIWKYCFPEHRVITHHSRHNRELALHAVCRESRGLVEKHFTRLLSPGAFFPLVRTSYIYVNVKTDLIVRDLTLPPDEQGSLFDLEAAAFNLRSFALLSGLSKVEHLAIGFDLLNENGGELFGPLQACCPHLKTLTLFPASQMKDYHRLPNPDDIPQKHSPCEIRLIKFDSNFLDYLSFRYTHFQDRTLKTKAYRGLITLDVLANHALQYADVFPAYLRRFGREWAPKLQISMLMRWNETCQGWQTRYLESDRYSKGFRGEDGKLYRGFIESGMVCDGEGEVLSRYDGIAELFKELELC